MPDFDTHFTFILIAALAAFLLGSVPFGLVVAKVLGLPDPRTIGSRNIGATNVLRTGSKVAAAATVLLDGGKGLLAVLLARVALGEDGAQVAALMSFLGHCYSVFLGFKGGKGVATFLGALCGLSLLVGAAICALWLLVCALSRYSSLSALVAAVASPFAALALAKSDMLVVLAAIALVLVWRHRENISRLRAGTETKVGGNKT